MKKYEKPELELMELSLNDNIMDLEGDLDDGGLSGETGAEEW